MSAVVNRFLPGFVPNIVASYSILSPFEEPEFNSDVVRPIACLGRGWQLISDQYFLYVGLCLMVVVLVTCMPFTGLLWGAWMSGILGSRLSRRFSAA